MKRTLTTVLIIISIAALLAGCTQTVEQPQNTTPPQTQTPSGGSAKIAAEAEAAEGKLIGRIDNNSVEIQMTPVDTLAFRVSDVLEQLEGIKDGDMVKFSYKLNEQGQFVITKIEKL